MTYIKNQILQNNAIEVWAMAIRFCDYILEGKATLEYRKHFVSVLHNSVELKYINSKGKPGRRPHRKKSTSEIGNKGLLRPKMGRTIGEKTSPAEESMPKGTEFCGRCLFWGNGTKKCHYPTAPFFWEN